MDSSDKEWCRGMRKVKEDRSNIAVTIRPRQFENREEG